METLFEIIQDALIDSLKMLPFLFGAYLLIEYLEHHSSERMERLLAGSSRFGPVSGALLGCVPQCGFSVAAANLYSGRIITPGTLVAVFLSTSDEALPILLANPGNLGVIGKLIAIKVVLAIAVRMGLDLLLRARRGSGAGERRAHMERLCEHCHCEEHGILRSALRHTVEIFVFVLIVSIVLGGVVEWLGPERLSALLLGGSLLQPAVSALLGFIPNCAASVLLTSLYLEGTISFGAVVAGLSTSAGVGFLVLFRVNRDLKENLRLCGVVYLAGFAAGTLIQLLA